MGSLAAGGKIGDQHAGFMAVRHRGEGLLRGFLFGLRAGEVGARFLNPRGDIAAAGGKALDLGDGIVAAAGGGGGLPLGGRDGIAQGGNCLRRRMGAFLRCGERRLRRVHFCACGGKLRAERLQPIGADQALGGGRAHRILAPARDKAVPTSHMPVPRHQPLPDGERLALVACRHGNLREAAGERCGCGDMIAKRARPLRQFGVAGRHLGPRPVARRRGGEARFQIVAEHGGERQFIAGGGAQLVDQPVFALLGGAGERLAQRLRLAVERREGGLGSRERGFRLAALAGGLVALAFRLGQRGGGLLLADLRRIDGGGCLDALGLQRLHLRQRGQFVLQAPGIAAGALDAALRGGERRLRDLQFRLFACLPRHRLGQPQLGRARLFLRLRDAGGERGRAGLRLGDPVLEQRHFLAEPGNRICGIMRQRILALPVFGKAEFLRVEIGEAAHGFLMPGLQRGEAMPGLIGGVARGLRGGAGLRESLRRGLAMRRFGLLRFHRGEHCRLARPGFFLRGGGGLIGLAPAGEERARLGNADRLGKSGVALRRLGLPPQRSGAQVHITEDFVQPGEIGLGCAQLLLGILAAHMQSGDARSLFQHGAPLLRAGGDDGGDFALTDQRRAVRAGRGIGEEQRHVLRSHVAAVGAIGAARAALDPADDFQFPAGSSVDRRGDVAGRHARVQHHLGKVAARAGGGAREDHILHAAAAHRPRARFAHHPANRLQQIGFAAAIGADDTGQPLLDPKLRRIDEALEAGEFKAANFHPRSPPQCARRQKEGCGSGQSPASVSFGFSTSQLAAFSTTLSLMSRVGVPVML